MDTNRHQKQGCKEGKDCKHYVHLTEGGFEPSSLAHCILYSHHGRRSGLTQQQNGSKKFISCHLHGDPDYSAEVVYATPKLKEKKK